MRPADSADLELEQASPEQASKSFGLLVLAIGYMRAGQKI